MGQSKSIEELQGELEQLRRKYAELKEAYKKHTVEQKFFVLFENFVFPTSLSKLPDGVIVDVNKAFEREFGFTKQEAVGKTSLELGINPNAEDRKRILESFRESGSVHNQEMILTSKSGEKCYYETNIDKVVINGEEFLLNTTQNISDYKRAENKLKENYNLLRIAGEKAKLGGWTVILSENRAYWSDEVAAIHEMPAGYSPLVEEGINFYAPEWHDKITEVFTLCATQGVPYDEEMEILTATGKRVWVRTIGEAVRDADGKIYIVQGAFQDISFRKQVEKELKNSEVRLELFFAQSLDGFFFMMLDEPIVWNDSIDKEITLDYVFKHHRITKANKAILEQYGATEKQFIGLTPSDLFAHDIKHGRQVWKDFFGKGQLHFDTHEKKFDGTDIIIEGDYICMYDAQGRITGHFGIQRDVTEIRLNEKILRKSKTELEEYFENDISADYVVSAEGEIFSCNRTFLEFFGFEKKSHTEKFNITRLYKNPNDRKELLRIVKENGKVENFEVDFVTRDGKEVNVILNAIGIFDDSGKLVKIRGYVVDVTKQKLAEKELRESEKKYHLLFANNPQPMWIYDLETLVFLEVNQAAINHYGYSQEEFLSMTLKDIRPLEDIPALMDDIKNTRLEYNTAGEWRHIKKNGEIIDVEIKSHSINFSNRNARHVLINDITERKRAQFEYQTMIKTSKDGFWIADTLTGKFIDINQAYCEMIGFSHEELLQMTIMDVEVVERHEETKQHIALIIEKGFDTFETKHKTKSGKIIDIEASVTYISSGTEQFFVFVKDISERKRAENEISKLSHSVEQSPASVIVTDLNGNMEYVNQKTLEITGYKKEELIGKNPRVFNSGKKPKEEYQQLWSAILSGKVWYGEFHNKKKNGELYWESASISPIFNDKQEIINYVAVKEDITERKRLEDAQKLMLEISELAAKNVTLTSFLAEVHQKIKQIIRADNFYMALYNETDNTFTFPYHVDEYDKVELNKPYDFSKGYTDYVLKSNQSLIITPENKLEIEIDGTVKGYGDKFSVWLGVPFIIADSSNPNGVIAIQDYNNLESYTETDKTIMEIIARHIGSFIERIKYITDLIQSKEKAEESDRLKSAFLSNMSHEIRTPMNGILGFTELLLSPNLNSEEKESYINIVHKSGQRMLNTVTDIVEISKIEAGLVHISNKKIDLNETVNLLVRFFQPEAEKKGLKLSTEMLLPEAKKHLLTDHGKLDSIITNLIKNAIKYTDSGTIMIGCMQKGSEFEFYVTDSGIGIPAHRQEAVFNRFEQADIADTRAFQGSGLGLAISKSYVEMLGGKIWVVSKEGSGSTFYFTLPANSNLEEKLIPDKKISGQSEKTKPKVKGLKILIAEDDEPSRQFLSILIKDFGNEILEVQTGNEALELCRQHKDIDLILMDIQMPGMNGYEATRQIREFNRDVIIIAQTAYRLSGDREKALAAGCNDYISKPIINTKLQTLIQKYFG
ncbi:MAG: hypothetical protein A2W85_11340 [Bacteroidetes bacterium GWF2_41_31]|nr:MAG: hypothetical protein A2W85_11340 [Bacteroidetes bacterium GWF2_41_31]